MDNPTAARPELWHGAGNSFALHDGRGDAPPPDAAAVCAAYGVDGLIALAPPRAPGAAAAVRFYNPDGAEAGACGNGLRCAAAFLDPAGAAGELLLETAAGVRAAAVLSRDGNGYRVRVSMGEPRFLPAPPDRRAFATILPGSAPTGESARPGLAACGPPILVDVGNPHAVLFLDDPPGDAFVAGVGAALQAHPHFRPTGGANVGFAFARSPREIELRVYERGAGETAACGTGACAAVAAAVAVRRCVRRVRVSMPGGLLEVEWPAGGQLSLTGPAARMRR